VRACGLAAGLLLSAGAAPREALAAAAVTTGGQGDLLEEYYAKAAATGSASFVRGGALNPNPDPYLNPDIYFDLNSI